MKIIRFLAVFSLLAATALAVILAMSPEAANANPAPVVTAVTPAADTTGSQVVITGSNLTLPPALKPDKVMFGTQEAVVNSCAPVDGAASSCNVTVPPQCPGTPKRVDVRVTVNGLESAVSSGDGFTYSGSENGPPPPNDCPSPSPSPSPSGTPTPSPTPTAPAPTPIDTAFPVTG